MHMGSVNTGDFGFLDAAVEGKRIIFVGESPHGVREFHDVLFPLLCHLHRHRRLRVVAFEAMYGLHPVFEAVSLGRREFAEGPRLLKLIAEYNEAQAEPLLATCVDIEHAISHTKPATVRYLSYLADCADSDEAAERLRGHVSKLPRLRERSELHGFLDTLGSLFHEDRRAFPSEDMDEIRFSLELMHASVDSHLLPYADTVEHAERRGKYFRASITRALAKAERRDGILLCYVGGAHVSKQPRTADEPCCGRWSEAEYFANVHPSTRGKVASLTFVAASYGGQEGYTDSLCDAERAYLDAAPPTSTVAYMDVQMLVGEATDATCASLSPDGPKHDGVFLFRDVAPVDR